MKQEYTQRAYDFTLIAIRFIGRCFLLGCSILAAFYAIGSDAGEFIGDKGIIAAGFIVMGVALFILIPWRIENSSNRYAWARNNQLLEIQKETEDIRLVQWTNRLLNYLNSCSDAHANVKIDTIEDYIKSSIEYGHDHAFGCEYDDDIDEEAFVIFYNKLIAFIDIAA